MSHNHVPYLVVASATALVAASVATDIVVNRKSMYMVFSVMGNISSVSTIILFTVKSVRTTLDAGIDASKRNSYPP